MLQKYWCIHCVYWLTADFIYKGTFQKEYCMSWALNQSNIQDTRIKHINNINNIATNEAVGYTFTHV